MNTPTSSEGLSARAKIQLAVVTTLTIAATGAALAWMSSLAPLAFILGLLAVYIVVGLQEYKRNDTPEGYFLFSRKMPERFFVWTFVATNVGLFSSIAYSALLAYYFGLPGMIWATVAWFVGMYWFSRKIPNLIPFFRRGNTLHEFIAQSYGRTPVQQARLRVLTSIVTGSLFWASIAIEVKFGAEVLAPVVPGVSAEVLAVLIAAAGVSYSYLAGYRGAVHTDLIQGKAMIIGGLAIVAGCVLMIRSNGFALPDAWYDTRGLTIGPDPLSLVAMVVLLLPYQFCVMDMWQRCIAISHSNFGSSSHLNDAQLATHLQRLTFRRAIIPFAILFGLWYLLGICAAGAGLTDDPTKVLPAFLAYLDGHSLLGKILSLMVIGVFASALISTFDTFLIGLVQTFMYDIYATIRKKYQGISEDSPLPLQTQFVDVSRFFVGFFGLLASAMALLTTPLLSFWVSMYALMLVLFPAVYLRARSPQATGWTSNAIGRSILVGFIVTLAIGILGTFVLESSTVVNLAPLVALVLSFGLLLGGGRHVA